MKWVIFGFLFLSGLSFIASKLIDKFGGADARVNMDSLPVEVLALFFFGCFLISVVIKFFIWIWEN